MQILTWCHWKFIFKHHLFCFSLCCYHSLKCFFPVGTRWLPKERELLFLNRTSKRLTGQIGSYVHPSASEHVQGDVGGPSEPQSLRAGGYKLGKTNKKLAKIESLSVALGGTLSTDTQKTLEGEYNFILPISRWGNWGLGRVYFSEQLGSSRALSWPQVFLGFTENSLSCNRPDWIAFQCGRK